jgi:hypothetical protein
MCEILCTKHVFNCSSNKLLWDEAKTKILNKIFTLSKKEVELLPWWCGEIDELYPIATKKSGLFLSWQIPLLRYKPNKFPDLDLNPWPPRYHDKFLTTTPKRAVPTSSVVVLLVLSLLDSNKLLIGIFLVVSSGYVSGFVSGMLFCN